MSYEVGQHIDLSHINGGLPSGNKKSFQTSIDYIVGTRFTFKKVDNQIKMVRQIQVTFA